MAKKVEGKTLVLGFLGLIVGVAALIFWIGLTGGSKHVPRSKAGIGFSADVLPSAAPSFGVMVRPVSDAGTDR